MSPPSTGRNLSKTTSSFNAYSTVSTVIWDLMLCSLVNVYRHFGATHYIRLQDRLIKSSKQTRKQSDSCVLHAACYLTFVSPAHSSILDVEAVRSVTSVNIYNTTRSHKPNDRPLTVTVLSTLKLIQLILSLHFIKHRPKANRTRSFRREKELHETDLHISYFEVLADIRKISSNSASVYKMRVPYINLRVGARARV